MNSVPRNGNERLHGWLFVAIPLAWLVFIAIGIWGYAAKELEPPVFDALSYVQKAQAFWAAVAQGKMFDPFSLDPQIRPFATVFFTHPFGFTEDFTSFYFLTSFLPAMIIAGTILLSGWRAAVTPSQRLVLMLLSVVGASMPAHFQFSAGSGLSVMGTWGFVDTLFGAIGALACALIVRSTTHGLVVNSALAAGLAILTILIKPAGLALMAVIGGAWAFLHFFDILAGKSSPVRFLKGVLPFIVSYSLTAAWLYDSKYFSMEHYQYGQTGMQLLNAVQVDFPSMGQILEKIRVSVGIPFFLLWLVGLGCALHQRRFNLMLLSLGIVAAGCWLWLIRTNLDHVRYFFPFPLMAFIFLVGPIVEGCRRTSGLVRAAAVLVLLPTLLIGYLLITPQPSRVLQSLAGISLETNLNPVAVSQGYALASELAKDPKRKSIIYYTATQKVYAFQGVMDWNRVLGFRGGNSIPALPVNWVDEHAYRLDHIIRARYVVFEPVEDPSSVMAAHLRIDSYDLEQSVVRAWLTTLTAADGVDVVSEAESGVRVIEIVNRGALSLAAGRLVARHEWRKVFMDGFRPIQFTPATSIAELPGNLLDNVVPLFFDGILVANIAGLTTHEADGRLALRMYVEQLEAVPTSASRGWTIFVHNVGADGTTVDAYAPYFSEVTAPGKWLVYELAMSPGVEHDTVAFGVGVFRPDQAGNEAFISPGADWDGTRTLVPPRAARD